MTNLGSQTISNFLEALSSKQPTPGGGAVAGLLAGLCASLGKMVLVYSQGKAKFEEHAVLHNDCLTFLSTAWEEALVLADADAIAYEALNALWKLQKDDPERESKWESVVQEAIDVPLRTMELSQRVLTTLEMLVGKTNAMLKSDLAIASILAEASAKSANINVQINLPQLPDEAKRDIIANKANNILKTCKEIATSIETSCQV